MQVGVAAWVGDGKLGPHRGNINHSVGTYILDQVRVSGCELTIESPKMTVLRETEAVVIRTGRNNNNNNSLTRVVWL